jgi:hypothetical protein
MIVCRICSEIHTLNPPQRSMLLGWGEVDVKCPTMGLTGRYKIEDHITEQPVAAVAVKVPAAKQKATTKVKNAAR